MIIIQSACKEVFTPYERLSVNKQATFMLHDVSHFRAPTFFYVNTSL
jgi:hypothetical protein